MLWMKNPRIKVGVKRPEPLRGPPALAEFDSILKRSGRGGSILQNSDCERTTEVAAKVGAHPNPVFPGLEKRWGSETPKILQVNKKPIGRYGGIATFPFEHIGAARRLPEHYKRSPPGHNSPVLRLHPDNLELGLEPNTGAELPQQQPGKQTVFVGPTCWEVFRLYSEGR